MDDIIVIGHNTKLLESSNKQTQYCVFS